MSEDVEMQIARAEREYERLTSASFAARARLSAVNGDPASPATDVARARAALQRLEEKRAKLRQRLEALERAADADLS